MFRLWFRRPAIAVSEVKREGAKDLVFRLNAADNKTVTLRPFNEIFYNYYNVYWKVLTPQQYAERKAALAAEAARQKALLAGAPLMNIVPANSNPKLTTIRKVKVQVRATGKTASIAMPKTAAGFPLSKKSRPMRPTNCSSPTGAAKAGRAPSTFWWTGKTIATQTLRQDKPGVFFDKTYAIPEELTRGKQKVTVRFQAHPGNLAGGIFGAKMLKKVPTL